MVERTGPKSYLTVLQDGRVWKRHVDHLNRRITSPLQVNPGEEETGNKTIKSSVTAAIENTTPPPPPPNHDNDNETSTDIEQCPSDNVQGSESSNVSEPDESNTAPDPEHSSETATDGTINMQMSVPPIACRRSLRVVKPPDHLIETMS